MISSLGLGRIRTPQQPAHLKTHSTRPSAAASPQLQPPNPQVFGRIINYQNIPKKYTCTRLRCGRSSETPESQSRVPTPTGQNPKPGYTTTKTYYSRLTETRPILEASSRRTYSQPEVISITKIFRKSAQHHEIRENTKYTYRVLSSLNLVYSVPHVHYDVRGSRYYMYIHACALRSLYLACLADSLTNCLKISSEGGVDESPYLITYSHSRSGTETKNYSGDSLHSICHNLCTRTARLLNIH